MADFTSQDELDGLISKGFTLDPHYFIKNLDIENLPSSYVVRPYNKYVRELPFMCQGVCEDFCVFCYEMVQSGCVLKIEWNQFLDDFIEYLLSLGKLNEPEESFDLCNQAHWEEYNDLYWQFRRDNGEKYYFMCPAVHHETKEVVYVKLKL